MRQRKEDMLADMGTGGIDGWMDMTKIYQIFALCLQKIKKENSVQDRWI